MMASSHATTPFHNHRDPCFHTSCIPNDNPSRIDLGDLWVHHPQWQTTTTTTTSSSTSNVKCNGNCRARIDVHHHKDKWARVRENVFPDGAGAGAGAVGAGASSADQDQACNPGCGGVSSLVQKWRGFEAKRCSGRCNSATASTTMTLQENIAISNHDNAVPELPPLVPAPVTNNNNDDDSIGDWESDRTALSGRSSFRGRDSDATESEKIRVVDIIRRLTEDRPHEVVGSISPPRPRTPLDHHQSVEQRCLPSAVSIVGSSPRIRGRQAYLDLLMKMERDRHKELERLFGRKAVTKFSHRGRIQALLRMRFLHQAKEGGHLKEGAQSQSNTCKSSESHTATQSVIAHFREKADKSSQNGPKRSGSCRKELRENTPAVPNTDAANQIGEEDKYRVATNSKSCRGGAQEVHIQDVSEDSTTSKQHNDHIPQSSHHEVNENKQHVVKMLHIYEDDVHVHHHEASSLSTFIEQQSTDLDSCNDNSSGKPTETTTSFQSTEIKSSHTNEINEHVIHKEEEGSTNHQIIEINYDVLTVDCAADHPVQSCYHDGESATDQPVRVVEEATAAKCWVSDHDVSYPEVGWEELHSDYQQQQEVISNNRDWIGEVARPRCDWEDLRQARYQEMLDPFSDNEEIRVLLQRKSVSNFLSGGMREKIDNLMISRTQGPQFLYNNQTQVKHEVGLHDQGQAVVVASGEGGDGEDEQDEEGEEYGRYFDEYEEAESSLGQQYNGSDGYIDHIISSLPPPSWPQNQGHESTDYPAQQPSSNMYYSRDNGRNSSYNAHHPAIEVELIYDLRRHMEQIHQEMSELRKSIKCCTDMQIKLQRSIKKEVAAALTHPENGRRERAKKVTNGGRCCICCKVQVDCLLYRCGHICTCFKCAHELKWSSGNCPICRAPILDIVRTYSNF